jgi:hypothetical protein
MIRIEADRQFRNRLPIGSKALRLNFGHPPADQFGILAGVCQVIRQWFTSGYEGRGPVWILRRIRPEAHTELDLSTSCMKSRPKDSAPCSEP